MKRFQNILFVTQGNELSDNALQQAAVIARSSNGNITFLVLHPHFPPKMEEIQKTYEKSMREAIQSKLITHNLPQKIDIIFESSTPHFVSVIQHVLKKDYDIVIKAAENLDVKQNKGFKSMDMSLLRKCPCPVWLCRPLNTAGNPKILTAVDPFSDTPEGQDLNIKLLQIGHSMAENMGGIHKVISCWDFEHESFLRDSPFAKAEAGQIDKLVLEAEKEHKLAAESLISDSGIQYTTLLCKRGKADSIIPTFVEREAIDVVVMGTVARTGIPGFIIGNTAENILQNLSCSMFAVKPGGFVSPIKAY